MTTQKSAEATAHLAEPSQRKWKAKLWGCQDAVTHATTLQQPKLMMQD